MLGYREEELVGRDWFELAVPADVRTAARAAFTAALAGIALDAASPESPVVTRAGARRSIAWTGRIVPTGDGVGMLVAGEDVTEQRIAQERVRHMAYHDALTGLANRAKLEEHLTLALARARRSQRAVAVLYIDLDHFKVVNDTLGHAAGDELLRQVATRLAACCRATDLVARHGGDEFMLLLTDIDGDAVQTARTVARGLLRTLETPFLMEGQEFEIAASVGVATFPRDASEMPELLKCADGALYQAKGDGRGTIRFPAAERAPAAGQLTLTARLRRALARDEFELHYQPVFDVASGRRGRGRGAAALERPRARDGAARRVHPGRRGQRADRADRRLGRRRGDRPGRGVARAGPRARHRVQSLPAPAALPGLRRPPARPLQRRGCRPGAVHRRDHRVGGDGRSRRARGPCSNALPRPACGLRSTTSAPTSPRSPACAICRCTS